MSLPMVGECVTRKVGARFSGAPITLSLRCCELFMRRAMCCHCGRAARCLPLWRADDLGLYVVKFRGAGQGILALIAELIAGRDGPRARAARAGDCVCRAQCHAGTQRARPGDSRIVEGQRRAESRARLSARVGDVRPCGARYGCGGEGLTCGVGSMRSRRMSIARQRMRTCWCGIASSTSSITARRSTFIMTGRTWRRKPSRRLLRSSTTSCCVGNGDSAGCSACTSTADAADDCCNPRRGTGCVAGSDSRWPDRGGAERGLSRFLHAAACGCAHL